MFTVIKSPRQNHLRNECQREARQGSRSRHIDRPLHGRARFVARSCTTRALRPMLYRKPQPTPGELPMEHDSLTELRFPFMRNLAWDRKYAGYMLRFRIGATGAEDVLLAECGLKDIRFVAQEGGSVGIGFKVTAHPKDEVDHGKIAVRLQQEIFIDLTPPDHVPTLFDGAPRRR